MQIRQRLLHPDEDWENHRPEIEIRNGLRWVRPYETTMLAHVKAAWSGRPLLDVLSSNYDRFPPEYWREAVQDGRITLNGAKADQDTVVPASGHICHRLHMHESPIAADPIDILHASDHLVVVNKPAGVPMHPVAMYRHNTLEWILAREHQIRPVFMVSRLDMPTSGLVVIPRTPEMARTLRDQLTAHRVTKKYYARVVGRFPTEAQECSVPLQYEGKRRTTQTSCTPKMSNNVQASGEGKSAQTRFVGLSYDSTTDTSLGGVRARKVPRVWLHAIAYTGPDWHFECPPPPWAQ
ncbi:RNA pseudouridine synthase superfamily protein [Acanthamoeba castellanii str. Neff]|uniref:RNA pseudouridine synthase superfamily protein n=1 Tax=Acanthamoeba castellanii (strain ATCC 30010 / Neff) TaxID=1257118 RepID=L8GRY2_ACACF|nr:RNA pseudouridine synthase superfamily protein [Acanthamoeba castellanii str. Neff]ELR15740.1 RNA pseudouridine synthase superfamily protein [Acanthamoeba castellanii str. Neff]